MGQEVKVERYGLVAQGFHWLIALLLLGLFVTNTIREMVPEESESVWLGLHMSLGILVFLLTIARLGWRKLVPPPVLIDAPKWSQVAANAAHVLLNLSTLLVPIFGYLRVASKDYAANFFGLQIPSVTGQMQGLHELMEDVFHGEPMEIFLYVLIGLHVVAALWHQYVLKDNGLRRMLPW
ncbi:cytochrome b [Thiocystis violacea]|uniref:cytochrome b n=1 Tax=Thiocystis violacea TaxID=13725 RepID=UPI0019041682|nr:cytochrome b/b6 domain-containing protein [Thiocystis violacea]MBK1722835.1 cytochrome B [Thiocystis violacea]